VLNARIRKRWRAGPFPIALIGERADLTYPYHYLGAGPETLADVAAGRGEMFEILSKTERPMLLIGTGALTRSDGAAVVSLAARAAMRLGSVTGDWSGFSVLHAAASRVGALDIALVPGAGGLTARQMAVAGALDVAFLLGADEIDIAPGAFVVYIGTHGDRGAHRADVILPGAAYTEKAATYVNTEGRAQRTKLAVFPPGDARDDWTIIRALSEVLGHTLPYDTQAGVRTCLTAKSPVFGAIDRVVPAPWGKFGAEGAMDSAGFKSRIANFYMTDPISRSSRIMAECTAMRRALADSVARTGTGS
jgi:NADH-quinone oxidoreductase subunit G